MIRASKPASSAGGEDRITSLPGFDYPTIAVQEHGTYGDEGKAAERRGALAALLSSVVL
jgi:hypothetical protein